MDFRILGAIEVVDGDGRRLALGGSRARALLAALLLRAGSAVSRESLIDALWTDPPASASHAVEVHASRLRRAVGKDRIRSRGHAYRLDLEPGELDLLRFRALASAGREALRAADVASAAALLEDALGNWRGDPVACLNGEPLAREVRGALEEERRTAVEALLDAKLALGLHEEVLPELRLLVEATPTCERLCGRLMIALYRCNRQVDALGEYRRLRAELRETLGLDPGPELGALERSILSHDTSLAALR